MVPVICASLGKGIAVNFLTLRPKQLARLAVPGDTVALEIVEMGAQRSAHIVFDHTRFDDSAACAAPQSVACPYTGGAPPAKG